jgi:hypothetical protein
MNARDGQDHGKDGPFHRWKSPKRERLHSSVCHRNYNERKEK